MLRMVDFAMAQSILFQEITVCGGLRIVANNKMFAVQKSITKIILNKPKFVPYENLFIKEFMTLDL